VSSADIKDILPDYFEGTKASEWKRMSKKKIDGNEVRIFANSVHNIEALVIGDGDEVREVGPLSFTIINGSLCFAPLRSRIACSGPEGDKHYEWLLRNHYNIDIDSLGLEENQENDFSFDDEDLVIESLEAAGAVFTPHEGEEDEDGDFDLSFKYDKNDPIYFFIGLYEDALGMVEDEDGMAATLSICPKSYWDANKAIPSDHVVDFLETTLNVDVTGFDEVCENMIIVPRPAAAVKRHLEARGLVWFPDLAKAGSGREPENLVHIDVNEEGYHGPEDEAPKVLGPWESMLAFVSPMTREQVLMDDYGLPVEDIDYGFNGSTDNDARSQWSGFGLQFYLGRPNRSMLKAVEQLFYDLIVEYKVLYHYKDDLYIFDHNEAAKVLSDFPRIGPLPLRDLLVEMITKRTKAVIEPRLWADVLSSDIKVEGLFEISVAEGEPETADGLFALKETTDKMSSAERAEFSKEFPVVIGPKDGWKTKCNGDKLKELFADLDGILTINHRDYASYHMFSVKQANIIFTDFPSDPETIVNQVWELVNKRLTGSSAYTSGDIQGFAEFLRETPAADYKTEPQYLVQPPAKEPEIDTQGIDDTDDNDEDEDETPIPAPRRPFSNEALEHFCEHTGTKEVDWRVRFLEVEENPRWDSKTYLFLYTWICPNFKRPSIEILYSETIDANGNVDFDWHEVGPMCYGVIEVPPEHRKRENAKTVVMFITARQVAENEPPSDQHLSGALKWYYGLDTDGIFKNESMENSFWVNHHIDDVREYLDSLGMREKPDFLKADMYF
jgi:hypothetical protein